MRWEAKGNDNPMANKRRIVGIGRATDLPERQFEFERSTGVFLAMTLPGNYAPLYLVNPTRTTYLPRLNPKPSLVPQSGLAFHDYELEASQLLAIKPYSMQSCIFADHHDLAANRELTILRNCFHLSLCIVYCRTCDAANRNCDAKNCLFLLKQNIV